MMLRSNVPTYMYIWYGRDRGVYYILRQSKVNYHTRVAAVMDAERESFDIPGRHGGPYLQILMIPPYESQEEHLKNLGKMLVKQMSVEQCNVS